MSVTERHLPQRLRAEVVAYSRWSLLVNVEDTAMREEYPVNIPITSVVMKPGNSEDLARELIRQTTSHEKKTGLHACGTTLAE